MKKIRLVLVLALCLFGLTACGEKKAVDANTVATLQDRSLYYVFTYLDQAGDSAAEVRQYIDELGDRKAGEQYTSDEQKGDAFVAGIHSYDKAVAEAGEFKGIIENSGAGTLGIDAINALVDDINLLAAAGNYEEAEAKYGEYKAAIENLVGCVSVEYDTSGKSIIATVPCMLGDKEAEIEFIYKDDLNYTLTSSATNIDYSFGEKMGKAGLNTLLGMGTVFAVLILIFGIISLFNFIPKIEAALKKKDAAPAATSVDNAITQIVESEELSDDLELVAVISAAIAAYEGSASADGYVVRSIRRVDNGSNWQRAL